MKRILGVILGLTFVTITAQQGRVGINTATPTEKLDVKGTLRVRDLPVSGTDNAIHTTGEDTSTNTKTSPYNSTKIVVADSWGILGKINDDKDLIPNNTVPGFSSDNNSTSMFVVRRYTVTDNSTSGTDSGKSIDTGMSVANWEGIISGWMTTFKNNTTATSAADFFNPNVKFGFRLKAEQNGNWKIIGDIATVQETSEIDVLFIKKEFVAADERTQ